MPYKWYSELPLSSGGGVLSLLLKYSLNASLGQMKDESNGQDVAAGKLQSLDKIIVIS